MEEFCNRLTESNLKHWAKKYSGNALCSYVIDLGTEIDEKFLGRWCKENCLGWYTVYSGRYTLFELEEDAAFFKLTWG